MFDVNVEVFNVRNTFTSSNINCGWFGKNVLMLSEIVHVKEFNIMFKDT